VKPKTPMQDGTRLRRRWKTDDGIILEWDYQHGTVEAYNRRGRHIGEFDPSTGVKKRDADPTRSVEP